MESSGQGPDDFRHQARKRFGQNFLHDQNIIRRILAALSPASSDHILEIGPGQGALTGQLLASGAHVDAVELDRDLAGYLTRLFADRPNFHLHQADILKFDISTLRNHQSDHSAKRLRVIGNLPYNISTPCIFHLLSFNQHITDMLFMLQLEVVERLAAGSGDEAYGRLSIMTQYFCQVEQLFTVPPGAFHPQPKVTSAIVRLTPYQDLPHPAQNFQVFQNVVRTAFTQRRKTLKNTLRSLITASELGALSIDAGARPENLSLADYVAISNAITSTPTATIPSSQSGEDLC
jgi:16S rRNA (adenine1518-N6/adenine1519-N6)-dimethyltransferase